MDPIQNQPISFEDTRSSFAYKTDGELKKARFLFSVMGNPLLAKIGLSLTPVAIKLRLPFVKSIIRNTIFRQFVGGETLEQTAPVATTLERYKVQVILDYGVEGGEGEEAFDTATDEFVKVVQYAATGSNIPYISIKVTGIARFGLLEKINGLMVSVAGKGLVDTYEAAIMTLTGDEKVEWEKVVARLERICKTAHEKSISVLVDAEESWIQDPVDALTMLMMEAYNKQKAIIYNTIQLYRHDRLAFLRQSYQFAKERQFLPGFKLVRGAYMEKERDRAVRMGLFSPIQKDKDSTDADFNAAIRFCVEHISHLAFIVASHNENSNLLATELLQGKGFSSGHAHVHFSQLYGMSDNITFNLAAHGFSVSKYLPFGPISDVVPYLMRRAQENSSVAGQTGRELSLINRELRRRG